MFGLYLIILCSVVSANFISELASDAKKNLCSYNGLYENACGSSSQVSSKIFPSMPMSFDLVKGDVGLPIFKWTYEQNKIIPSSRNQRSWIHDFMVPDQLDVIEIEQDDFISYQNEILPQFIDQSLIGSGKALTGPLSQPGTINYILPKFNSGSNSVYVSQYFGGRYLVLFNTNPIFSSSFNDVISYLHNGTASDYQ